MDCFGINDAGTLIPMTKEIAFVPVMLALHSFRHPGCHFNFLNYRLQTGPLASITQHEARVVPTRRRRPLSVETQ